MAKSQTGLTYIDQADGKQDNFSGRIISSD